MNRFKWDDLRYFLAVARGGSLASASAQLDVNASTVHRRLGILEEALGSLLFDRSPRGYALTSIGAKLLDQAVEVEEAVLALERTVTGHDRTATGPVTLTLPETLLDLVAPRLAEVCTHCPGLRPILEVDDRVLNLGAGVDMALRPSHDPPHTAVGRRMGSIAWCIYGLGEESEGEGETMPWVVYSHSAGPELAKAWRQQHYPSADVLMEVSSVGAMHRVLSFTPARGLLPCYLGDPNPRLRRLGDPIDAIATDLWLLIHADLRRSARVRAMVDLLVPRLQALEPQLAGTA